MQVNVKKLRLDIYDTPTDDAEDKIVDDVARVGDEENMPPIQDDVFDELLQHNNDALRNRITTQNSEPSIVSIFAAKILIILPIKVIGSLISLNH